jgi:hypothetical protein
MTDSIGRRSLYMVEGKEVKTKRVFILHILTHVEYSKGGWKR